MGGMLNKINLMILRSIRMAQIANDKRVGVTMSEASIRKIIAGNYPAMERLGIAAPAKPRQA